MTELEHAITHIKTRADAWAVKEVTEALRSISERLDKALSQEPTRDIEKSNFSQEQYLLDTDTAYKIGYEQGKKDSRRKGYWIETEYHRWRCSVCREKGMSEWDNIHDVRTNFCPDCGAKMESEDKG